MTRAHRNWFAAIAAAALIVLVAIADSSAHDGPPFPIVSNQTAGPYVVSVWTDPDATDDGSAGGQFWVMVKAGAAGSDVPAGTRATVTIAPFDRPGDPRAGATQPVGSDIGRQFVALVMDHEGRFGVRVVVDGPLGEATVESDVDATYDARPPPAMLFLYLAPFVLIGGLWLRAISRRREGRTSRPVPTERA